MANHASHAALPYPIKGARFSILIPYLDADGDPTDPTTPDTEISKDDGAAADTAEEVSSPKNSIGLLTLSGAEMDCSCASLAAKAASGPKTTLMTLFPRVLPVLTSGTAQAGAAGTITLASGAPAYSLIGAIVKTTGGTGGGGTGGANNQARVITAYNGSTKVATVTPNWETTPDNTTTYEVLLTDMGANAMAANLTSASFVPSEPAAVPSFSSTLEQWFAWLFAKSRNKITQTSTTQTLRNDADNASIGSSSVSDDGTTGTRGKWS